MAAFARDRARARATARPCATGCARCPWRRCRVANIFLPQIHALRPLRGQMDSAANVLQLLDGVVDHRVAPVVRQGAGRVLAALRAAGARRRARPARLRRLHGVGASQRGDGQPARVRRRTRRSSRTGTSTGSRSRSRSTRWRSRSPSSRASPSAASSGSSTRTSPTACRRSSPPDGGLNSGFMIAQYSPRRSSRRTRCSCHPASVDSIPTSAGQEDHVSMGNDGRAEGVAGARELRDGRSRSSCCAAAQAVEFRAPLEPGRRRARDCRAAVRELCRGCATTARSRRTSRRSRSLIRRRVAGRGSRPKWGSCDERDQSSAARVEALCGDLTSIRAPRGPS